MLSPELETETAAEDTAPSTPNGEEDIPASTDVLEEVRYTIATHIHIYTTSSPHISTILGSVSESTLCEPRQSVLQALSHSDCVAVLTPHCVSFYRKAYFFKPLNSSKHLE